MPKGAGTRFIMVVGSRGIKMRKGGKRMTIEVALLLSVVSVAFSIFFGLKNNRRSDTKEIEERVRENTKINMKLDNIALNTSDIKNELSAMKKDVSGHEERIIKVEDSAKSAHHRIDGIEDRLNCKEG